MTDRPNVLWIVPDQHRPDFVGFHGDVPVRTPALDELATEGVAFRNAVCPSPLCGPSRACLATGNEYDRAGVRGHDADTPIGARTVYRRLRDEAGYHVMGCGKFDLQKRGSFWGDDTWESARNGFSAERNCAGKWAAVAASTDGGEFDKARDPYMRYLDQHDLAEDHVHDFRHTERGHVGAAFPTPLPEHAYCDNWIGRQGLEMLDEAPDDRPWFLQVNFAGPHYPWDVTEEMHGWYRDPDVTFPEPVEPGDDLTPAEHQAVRRNYAAMVENIDRWLGRYCERLAERGELDDTVIAFAADHGELLGDHGQFHKRLPWWSSVGVPMVIAGPGVRSRGVVDDPASILDLHATALDHAGLDPGRIDSRSLAPYLAGDSGPPRDVGYAGLGPWRMVDDGRYSLIRGFDPAAGDAQLDEFDAWDEAALHRRLRDHGPLLYDRRTDPGQTTNVADDHPEVVTRLDARLDDVRLCRRPN